MADNYLITGYWGEPHVTAENDRGINAATFGTGRFVLPVGEQFRAEYIGNNTIRMYDGKLMDNGAAAGIPAGEYIDLLVSEAGQGKKRNDLIVFQYEQNASTLIESGTFVVVKGEEVSGSAADPVLTQQDLLTNNATFDQMALWRVSVSGTTISAPVKLFNVLDLRKHASGHAIGGEDEITPDMIGAVSVGRFSGDLNTLTTPGMYRLESVTNDPSYADYGNCIVLGKDGSDTLTQIIGCYTSKLAGSIKFREGQKISGVWNWGEWKQLATTDYAVNKAGDTMTGALTARQRVSAEFPNVVTGRVEAHSAGVVDLQRLTTDGKYVAVRLADNTSPTKRLTLIGNDTGEWFSYDILHTGNMDSLLPDTAFVITGSYEGTATSGEDNKNSVVLPAEPALFLIQRDGYCPGEDQGGFRLKGAPMMHRLNGNQTIKPCKTNWNESTSSLEWWYDGDADAPSLLQYNLNTHYYIAIY